MAAVGKRLACFKCSHATEGSLSTDSWINTWEEVSTLSVCQASGIIATASRTQSVILYKYDATNGFELLCADAHSRHAISCLPLHLPRSNLQVKPMTCPLALLRSASACNISIVRWLMDWAAGFCRAHWL
jgi:hypothetical protein